VRAQLQERVSVELSRDFARYCVVDCYPVSLLHGTMRFGSALDSILGVNIDLVERWLSVSPDGGRGV
jgi:hypothetical protein